MISIFKDVCVMKCNSYVIGWFKVICGIKCYKFNIVIVDFVEFGDFILIVISFNYFF